MPNSKDLKGSDTPSILVVGDGGTGKTRFLAGCPKPFVYDFDAGMLSARDMDCEYETFKDAPWRDTLKLGLKGAANQPGVDKARGFYPWGESWPRFIDHLNEKMWPRIEKGELQGCTLGTDSITTMAAQSMNYVLKTGGKTGMTNPSQPDWGMQLRLLEVVMEQLAAWPVRLVVTSHIKRDDNLVSGEKEYLPLVGGQFGGRIGVYFDEVYYTKVDGSGDKRKFTAKTEASGLYRMAKSRYNVKDGTELNWGVIGAQIAAAK